MISAAGVDTWSICWYLRDDSPECRAMEALATVPTARGKLLAEDVAGHKIGWFPGSRLLFAEGHPDEDGLGSRDSLSPAFDRVSEGLRDRGIIPPPYKAVTSGGGLYRQQPGSKFLVSGAGPIGARPLGPSGFAGVRRLDSTVDLRFDDPLVGLAILKGISSLSVPRMKLETTREAGGRRVETVRLKGYSGKRVLGRVYDKGNESREVPRGQWIRPEDQRRYDAGTRLPLDAVTETSYIRDAFVRRFETLWESGKGITVGGAPKLVEEVVKLAEAEAITGRQAVTLVGSLMIDGYGHRRLQHRSTVSRQKRLARKFGLVLADDPDDQVQVDLGSVLEETLDTDHWGFG